jgi:hypothetical protein
MKIASQNGSKPSLHSLASLSKIKKALVMLRSTATCCATYNSVHKLRRLLTNNKQSAPMFNQEPAKTSPVFYNGRLKETEQYSPPHWSKYCSQSICYFNNYFYTTEKTMIEHTKNIYVKFSTTMVLTTKFNLVIYYFNFQQQSNHLILNQSTTSKFLMPWRITLNCSSNTAGI